MAIIVENGPQEPWCDRTLRAMFEDRKSVFVDLLKWDVPALDGRFELDEFDDEHATYVIIPDEDGDHLGSARLLPTTRPLFSVHYSPIFARRSRRRARTSSSLWGHDLD